MIAVIALAALIAWLAIGYLVVAWAESRGLEPSASALSLWPVAILLIVFDLLVQSAKRVGRGWRQ